MSAHYAMCKYDDDTGTYVPLEVRPITDELIQDDPLYKLGAASRDAEIAECERRLHEVAVACADAEQERDQLRAELVKALAACNEKDEASDALLKELDGWILDESSEAKREALAEALAIQPDDAALKAWLGNPVSYLYKHSSAFGDGEFWSHRTTHNGVTAIESKALYAPKGEE